MATVLEHPTEQKVVEDQAPKLRRFTVEEYYKMGEAGVLRPDERVELLEGVILAMSPKGIKHAFANDRACKFFIKRLDDRAVVRNQNPIRLNDASEPEPDIVLAALPEEKYLEHHPTPPEILLILEVAGSTLSTDRKVKTRLYAQAGIIQYGILNVEAGELEDYREPSAEGYRSKQTYTAQQSFSLVAFPDVTIAISELLPPV
jgi:Uma2 family endonuclease